MQNTSFTSGPLWNFTAIATIVFKSQSALDAGMFKIGPAPEDIPNFNILSLLC